MAERNRQTFLQGALILLVSSVLVKILGAVFKIPLLMIIKEEGSGLFHTSYNLYVFFVLAAKGVSIAVSKMVSESESLGKNRESDRIFGVAVVMLGIIGLLGTAALYFGADGFSQILKNTKASTSIRAIAPAVLFVALVSAFRGYFQGKQNMYPTAVSEVIEASGKLVIGIILALWFIGASTELAAAGAVTGVTCSTLFSLLFIIAVYIADKKHRRIYAVDSIRSRKSIAKELIIIALPITIGASVSSLTSLVDIATIMSRLQSITQVTPEFVEKYSSLIDKSLFDGGIYEGLANSLYGLYNYAVVLFNMPLTLIVALSISVLPAISGALSRNDYKTAQKTTLSVIRITILFALPCAVGLSVLSGPVLKFIFDSTLASTLLQYISVAIVFVSLVQVTNAVLQAYGKLLVPLINMLIGCVVKIAVNYYLIAIPSVNIDGAPIGTIICYSIIAALNLIWIIKITGCKFSIGEFIIRPVLSAGGMAVAVIFVRNFLTTVNFSERLAVIPSIAVGVVVYTVMIFLVGAVGESDVLMMPKGRELAQRLKKLHLLRKQS